MCVGKRNYKYYFSFILSVAVITLLMNVQVIYLLTHISKESDLAFFIINIILSIYFFAAFLFVTFLCSFHAFLIIKNITTV